jgi:uncharacterized protein (TIGR02145 family)
MKNIILIGFLFLSLITLSQTTGTLTDARDGKVYKTVVIGTQTWMAENLNTAKFQNGDFITHAKTAEQWIKAEEEGKPAYCFFNNSGNKEMVLYNFYAVTDERFLAPEGYRIPSKTDWDILIKFLGGNEIAGLKVKSISGRLNENNKSFNGSNESGFNALPLGIRTADYKYGDGGEFDLNGKETTFWSSTVDKNIYSDGNQAFGYSLNNYSHKFGGSPFSYYMGCGFSIRCIKE